MRIRHDPGECIVCGAPQCACGGGPIEIAQLPQRDAAPVAPVEPPAPVLVANEVQAALPAGVFTSGTYRRKRGSSSRA